MPDYKAGDKVYVEGVIGSEQEKTGWLVKITYFAHTVAGDFMAVMPLQVPVENIHPVLFG